MVRLVIRAVRDQRESKGESGAGPVPRRKRRIPRGRRSVRLPGRDYGQAGAYFVTLVTAGRRCIFGAVRGETLHHGAAGRAATTLWSAMPRSFPYVTLDDFVVMPNHVHAVLHIRDESSSAALLASDGRGSFTSPTATLGSVVRSYKIGVTRWMRERGYLGDVWQRGYYDRVVRGHDDLLRIRNYIAANPGRWLEDDLNPSPRGRR